MGYEFYKTIHYVSIMSLVISLILIIVAMAFSDIFKNHRKIIFAIHGMSWIVLFGSAHGLVKATGIETDFPDWAKAKFVIWIILGLMPFIIKRRPNYAYLNSFIITSLITGAIYLAVYKPF